MISVELWSSHNSLGHATTSLHQDCQTHCESRNLYSRSRPIKGRKVSESLGLSLHRNYELAASRVDFSLLNSQPCAQFVPLSFLGGILYSTPPTKAVYGTFLPAHPH